MLIIMEISNEVKRGTYIGSPLDLSPMSSFKNQNRSLKMTDFTRRPVFAAYIKSGKKIKVAFIRG